MAATTTTQQPTSTTDLAFSLFEKASALYDDWMSFSTSRRFYRVISRLERLGYDYDSVVEAIKEGRDA